MSAITQDALEATNEELLDRRANRLDVERHTRHQRLEGLADQIVEPHLRSVESHLEDPDRAATQTERVRRALRREPGSEDAADRVHLVGDRDDPAGHRRRQSVSREARPIVFLDRERYFRCLAGGQRVVAAHDALQVGELDNGVRDQVGLRQVGGPTSERRLVRRRLDHARQPCRQASRCARPSRRLSPSVSWNTTDSSLGSHCLERNREVFAIEERRVREPSTDDALMPSDDLLGALGVAVVGDYEPIVETAIRALHREVALMTGHRVLEHLTRDRKELLVEGAHRHGRPFDQVDDLGEGLVGNHRLSAVM